MKKVILKSYMRGDVVKIVYRSDRDLKCYIQHSEMSKGKKSFIYFSGKNS